MTEQIAQADFDEAYYIGDGEQTGGIYFDAAKGPDDRWYVTTAYDVGHSCGDMTVDDGPYPDERAALEAGLEQGIQWCIDNNVRWLRRSQALRKRFPQAEDVASLEPGDDTRDPYEEAL